MMIHTYIMSQTVMYVYAVWIMYVTQIFGAAQSNTQITNPKISRDGASSPI